MENTNSQTLGPKVLEDTFEAIKLDISKMDEQQTQNYNLTRKEKQALRASNKDIVINKADKGSTVVVRHRNDYIQEISRTQIHTWLITFHATLKLFSSNLLPHLV